MKKQFPLAYWNTGDVAVAVVAVATYFNDDLFDWAAYIGGTTKTEHEEVAYEETAQYGAKLDVGLASFFVTRRGLPLPRDKFRP